jgi:hypothetical protein
MSFFITFFIIFILGDLIFGWWQGSWWVWLILGFSFLTALTSTIRYISRTKKRSADSYADSPDSYSSSHTYDGYEPTNAYETNTETIEAHETPTKPISYGAKNQKVNYCPYCGSPIEPGDEFCKNCGANI